MDDEAFSEPRHFLLVRVEAIRILDAGSRKRYPFPSHLNATFAPPTILMAPRKSQIGRTAETVRRNGPQTLWTLDAADEVRGSHRLFFVSRLAQQG